MSIASLLVMPGDRDQRARAAWEFDHAMAHRAYMAIMAPLTRFSAMPYFVEPVTPPPPLQPRPAEMWPLKHQQAHKDFTSYMPVNYNAARLGIATSQILVDNDLNTPEGRAWNTFANHMEHLIANSTMLPYPTGTTLPPWYKLTRGLTYPFW
jgi:hypothetical protein